MIIALLSTSSFLHYNGTMDAACRTPSIHFAASATVFGLSFFLKYVLISVLQCFDTVGWVAQRASGLLKMGEWWRWALVNLDGVAPSRLVGVCLLVFPYTMSPEVLFWHRLTRVVLEKGP